jgi:5,10-methylene-tetrahydrofolate dehydrogenase/methenyl tetrahydrofolate cyclohydrolase
MGDYVSKEYPFGFADQNTAAVESQGAVVIDVGTTRVPDATKKSGFKLTGDVKFDEVAPKCSYITPVPGGVGPMTIVSLMKNTFWLEKRPFTNKCHTLCEACWIKKNVSKVW